MLCLSEKVLQDPWFKFDAILLALLLIMSLRIAFGSPTEELDLTILALRCLMQLVRMIVYSMK